MVGRSKQWEIGLLQVELVSLDSHPFLLAICLFPQANNSKLKECEFMKLITKFLLFMAAGVGNLIHKTTRWLIFKSTSFVSDLEGLPEFKNKFATETIKAKGDEHEKKWVFEQSL